MIGLVIGTMTSLHVVPSFTILVAFFSFAALSWVISITSFSRRSSFVCEILSYSLIAFFSLFALIFDGDEAYSQSANMILLGSILLLLRYVVNKLYEEEVSRNMFERLITIMGLYLLSIGAITSLAFLHVAPVFGTSNVNNNVNELNNNNNNINSQNNYNDNNDNNQFNRHVD